MEVEDAISSKFQTLIESLMVKATSDIVKTFTDVFLETREEISRSWKKIDELKQQLRDSEERRMQAITISQVTCSLKKEDGGMSCLVPQVSVLDTGKTSPEDGGRKDEEQAITDEKTDPKQSYVAISGPATHQIISPVISGTNLSINGPKQNNDGQLSQAKSHGPPKSSAVTKRQKCKNKVVSKSPLHTVSVVSPPRTSSNTTIKIFNTESKRKQAVVKKKYIYKKIGSTCNNTTTHELRDRQLLGTQRPCLCCSSDQCFREKRNPKTTARVVTRVYTCKQCGKRFYEWMHFKHHGCVCRCSRCGQTFTSLKNMATHRRNVATSTKPYPYSCNLCGYSIATQCGWNMHRRTHAHSNNSQNAQYSPELSQINTVPKELNARVEVRLERISDAQLEAALCPKGTLLMQETTSLSSLNISQNLPSGVEISLGTANALSTCTNMNTPELREESTSRRMIQIGTECLPSTSTTGTDKDVKQADIQSASAQIKQEENGTHWNSLTAQEMPSVKCEKRSSTKRGNSSLRRKKMADCNHGIHDGIFPVEKIVRWRNTKGRNEVRVKWMPCSLCGAKWKNTWEPAESFIPYKDSKNEMEA